MRQVKSESIGFYTKGCRVLQARITNVHVEEFSVKDLPLRLNNYSAHIPFQSLIVLLHNPLHSLVVVVLPVLLHLLGQFAQLLRMVCCNLIQLAECL